MWLIRKNRKTGLSASDSLAKSIAAFVVGFQKKLSLRLQRWDAAHSIAAKKRAFIMLFLCCSFYCLYLLGRAFLTDTTKNGKPFLSNELMTPWLQHRPVNKKADTLPHTRDSAKKVTPFFNHK